MQYNSKCQSKKDINNASANMILDLYRKKFCKKNLNSTNIFLYLTAPNPWFI